MMEMSQNGFKMCWVVVLVVSLPGVVVSTDVATRNVSDSLSSLHVRQEAALRKLDGLTAMVSKVDDLETKIDLLTNLLNDQKEKYSEMEAKLASIETKQETLLGALEDKIDAKVEKITTEVGEKLGQVEDKIEAKFEEMEDVMRMTLESMEGTIEDISSNMTTLNESLHLVGASVCQVEDRLDYVFFQHPEECEAVAELLANTSDTSRRMIEAHMFNLTLTAEAALDDMKGYVLSAMENVTNRSSGSRSNSSSSNSSSSSNNSSSQPQCNTPEVHDWQESLSRLEALVAPSTNATKHLIAAVFNRIRVSNLAMDKRLGALLHTSSVRQQVLQDTLLASIASVDILVRSQSQDVYRKLDSRLGGLEDSLAASAKRHAKELATQVLEAANHTLGAVASDTTAHLRLLLLTHTNTTAAIHLHLDQLQELYNLTASQLDAGHPCVTPVPAAANEISSTTTTTYTTTQPLGTLDDQVSNMRDELSNQLIQISEELAGLRIYYSTSLHMHRQQMAEEVGAVQAGVRRAVQDTLAKMARTLEKLRRSSLSYLDAAVTSVSSAAVASAQATTDQLNRALRDVANALQGRLAKVESGVMLLTSGCPSDYTWVGGTCLLALTNAHTSWEEARSRCKKTGGDLATIPNNVTMGHVRSFLYTTHAWELAPPPPYWVGGKQVEGEWTWVTGAPVQTEVVAASRMEEEESGECLMSWGAGVRLLPGICRAPRAALCQHQQHALSHVSQNSYKLNNSHSNALDHNINAVNTNDYLFYTVEDLD